MNEVAEFNPKSELPDEFEYVDLESVVGTEMISHRTETKDSAPSRAQRLAQPGDVFFQTVRPYQKNNYLFSKLDNNYVFSTGYAQMRPNIDTAFLMSFLQTDSFVKIVLDNCTGTSYPAINSSDLSNLEISLPKSFEEQKKVGKTIISIDITFFPSYSISSISVNIGGLVLSYIDSLIACKSYLPVHPVTSQLSSTQRYTVPPLQLANAINSSTANEILSFIL